MDYSRTFSVEGEGMFPFDLLYLCCCVPASKEDAWRLSGPNDRRRIALVWVGGDGTYWRETLRDLFAERGWPFVAVVGGPS